MNKPTPAEDAPVAGYGDKAAEMLVARFVWERMDRFEPWLHAQGFKSSFFQRWIDNQRFSVHQEMQFFRESVPTYPATLRPPSAPPATDEKASYDQPYDPERFGPVLDCPAVVQLVALFLDAGTNLDDFSAWLRDRRIDPEDALLWLIRTLRRLGAVSAALGDWGLEPPQAKR